MVGILILVYMDVLELLLVIGQHIWMLIKKTQGQHNQIIKVHCFRLTEFLLVSLITLGDDLGIHISSLGGIGHFIDQVIFSIGNSPQNSPFIPFLRIQIQGLQNPLHQGPLLTWIDNSEVTIVTNMIRISTKDAHTHRVEGRNQAILGGWIQLISPLLHLPSSFIGKGNGQNIPRIDHFFIDQVSDAVGQDTCLTRTSSRHDQKGTFCRLDRLCLAIIHTIQ